MFAKRKPDSTESSQSAKSPLATSAIIPPAIFFTEANRRFSSAVDLVVPSTRFVVFGFESAPREMLEG